MLNEIISLVGSNTIAVVLASEVLGIGHRRPPVGAYRPMTAAIAWIQCPLRPMLPHRNSRIKRLINYAVSTFGNYGFTPYGPEPGQIPHWMAMGIP